MIDHPFFARLWTWTSRHEPESVTAWRRENLAGLTGRVLEVGAGTGTNFPLFQTDEARHVWEFPAWVPLPVLEFAIGRAIRPA